METRWLSPKEREAWLRLIAVAELLPAALDAQLRESAALTHFEYFVLAMLSEALDRTLRMTSLSQRTNASLTRLSHVINRLEKRGLVERFACPEDGRATNARLTSKGWELVVATAPGHVTKVRELAIDPLTPQQISQLIKIGDAILKKLDPEGHFTASPKES
ncbi:MAG: MarR family transcriptional regulator [Candidatus Planktophila sp.]|nr:MarR family transcriptional regulator [Candidatus Planktophila sp.]